METGFAWHLLSLDDRTRLLDGLAAGEDLAAPLFVELHLPAGRDGEMLPGEVLGLVDQLAAAGVRALRLVESPLGHFPLLGPLISQVRQQGLALAGVVSAGVQLDDAVVAELLAGPCAEIVVQLVTCDGTDYRRLTGRPERDFGRARARLELLQAEIAEQQRSLLVAARFAIDRHNFRRMTRMFWLARGLGCERVEIAPLSAMQAAAGIGSLDALLREEDGGSLHPQLNTLFLDADWEHLELCFPFASWRVMVGEWRQRTGRSPAVGYALREHTAGLAVVGSYAALIDARGGVSPLPRGLASEPWLAASGNGPIRAWRGKEASGLRHELRGLFLRQGRMFAGRCHHLNEVSLVQSATDPELLRLLSAPGFCPLMAQSATDAAATHASWTGGPAPLARALEVFLFRAYHRVRSGKAAATTTVAGRPVHGERHEPEGDVARPAARLHLGSGSQRLEGWVNLDLRPLPGVDVVGNVNDGLPFARAEAVYAEHFLEHLAVDDALGLLDGVWRCLIDGGWLRLSTPNLDWVWSVLYRLEASGAEKGSMAIALNRSFYGWEHRFLWNRELLATALAACGFIDIAWCRYGETSSPVFLGIEQHDQYEDDSELPHVLVVEARKGERDESRRTDLERQLEKDFLVAVRSF